MPTHTASPEDDQRMSTSERRITQLLLDAHASELALVSTLRAHIAMTPAGEYRIALQAHLRETRDHADRLRDRIEALGADRTGPLQLGYGIATGMLGQALVIGKFPVDLVRGMSGEAKLLHNLRDECASEAMEIAQYLELEQYAREVGDEQTAQLAASIRVDEEEMLDRLFELIPRLTADEVAAQVDGNSQFNVLRIGAIDGVRSVAATAARTVSKTAGQAARRAVPADGSSTGSDRPRVTRPRAATSRTSTGSNAKRTRTPASRSKPTTRTKQRPTTSKPKAAAQR